MSIADFDQTGFIQEVRAFMAQNKLSFREFAKLSGVASLTLYRLEAKKSEIKLSTLRKLEQAMKDYKV